MSRTLEFTVIGEPQIHCAGCEQRIGNALRRLGGVTSVQASAETRRVAVRFDHAQVTPGEVRAKLEQLGYRVLPVPDRGGTLRPKREASMKGLASERSSP